MTCHTGNSDTTGQSGRTGVKGLWESCQRGPECPTEEFDTDNEDHLHFERRG